MSLVARHLEEAGLPTVVMGSARDIVEECGVADVRAVVFRGGDVRELGLDLYLTFDGQPVANCMQYSETNAEAWQPGDIALIFREDTWDGFHRADADGRELKDGDKDQGCVGISAGYSSSMKLDTCALDGLEWSGV